jgi:hypothetical protein
MDMEGRRRLSPRRVVLPTAVALCAALAAFGSAGARATPLETAQAPPSARASQAVGAAARSVHRGRAVAAAAAPPSSYPLPGDAVYVATSAELVSALDEHASANIVLRNGVYDNGRAFDDSGGNRLYAEHPGGAVFRAGLALGGNRGPGGGLVRGVAFDVSDPSKTLRSSIIRVWGTGERSQILDVTMNGHSALSSGINVREANGVVIRRVVVRNFVDWGILVDENDPDAVLTTPALVEDADVADVGWPTPQASNGTAEACVWIGNTATVRRVHASGCAWEGLWTGTAAHDSLFEDVTVTHSAIGVYVEHFVHGSTFRRLQIGPDITSGVYCEWADPDWGSKPACVDDVFEQSSFDTRKVGVWLDEGTAATTVRTSTFVNQCWAAIGSWRNDANRDLYDTSGNDYSGLRPGAESLTTSHIYAARC